MRTGAKLGNVGRSTNDIRQHPTLHGRHTKRHSIIRTWVFNDTLSTVVELCIKGAHFIKDNLLLLLEYVPSLLSRVNL